MPHIIDHLGWVDSSGNNEREYHSEDGKKRALGFSLIRERNYKEKV